jgi:hypothetical protein
MGQLSRKLTALAWLLLWMAVAVQSASAQKRYPSIEEAWDGTDYRALIQRVETDGLALPTLSDTATKPVFIRMIDANNIPLRVGLNSKLAATIRFQRLDSALQPLQKLVVLYSNEVKKGRPCASELAKLMVYEAKVLAALLDVSDPYLSSLEKDKRYQFHVDASRQMKSDARKRYADLVQSMAETRTYATPDILEMVRGALDGLPAYLPILTDQDRQDLTQKLTQQIAKTADQALKTSLTELRDAIKHRRIRT